MLCVTYVMRKAITDGELTLWIAYLIASQKLVHGRTAWDRTSVFVAVFFYCNEQLFFNLVKNVEVLLIFG